MARRSSLLWVRRSGA